MPKMLLMPKGTVCAVLIVMMCAVSATACADITVYYLDVGHGDCTIITCDGAAMIIDGGRPGKSDMVFSFLRSHGIATIQAAIATHPDSDHIGGLPAAFHASTVNMLYVPILEYEAKRHNTLMRTARDAGVPIVIPKDGDTFQLGGATVTIIVPSVPNPTDNDLSLITRVVYGEHAFLFCADIDAHIEDMLLRDNRAIQADVLKVAHHGSETATTPAFLHAVNPSYAVISSNDQYGAAENEVTARIEDAGITLLHTYHHGSITITSDGSTITALTEK